MMPLDGIHINTSVARRSGRDGARDNKPVRNYDVRMREISPCSGNCDKPTYGNT